MSRAFKAGPSLVSVLLESVARAILGAMGMGNIGMSESLVKWKSRTVFALLIFHLIRTSFGSSLRVDPRTLQPFSPLRYLRTQDDDSQKQGAIESLFQFRQEVDGPSFLSGPSDAEVIVSLINGEAEAQMSYSFVAEANYSIDDYLIVPLIGNTDVITADDVNIVSQEAGSLGARVYNITVDLDFNKWVGISNFGLEVINASTSEVVTQSPTSDLIAVGISFFSAASGGQTLVGGPNYPLSISLQDLLSSNDVNLGVFIQFYDGTTSNESLSVPLDGINISTSGLDGQLNYSESCSANMGTFDGSDVVLPAECGLGFSTDSFDGSYKGPNFGFDFNPAQNGSFSATFEWNELVEGSDLEPDGYRTYIDVTIDGELPPVVTIISPSGPFNTVGTDVAVIFIENLSGTLSEIESWSYDLSIAFESGAQSASFQRGNSTVLTNGTVSVTFTLPPGTGTNLPWTLTISKPSDSSSAVDETNPPYLFTFLSQVFIDSITPNSGPEQGGTAITLTGEFPGADIASITVFFDGTAIDPSLLTSTGVKNITFITPSRESVGTGFDVNVTVAVGDDVSNGITFSYVPNLVLESLTPASGPIDGGTEVTLTGQFVNFDPSQENNGIYFEDTQIDSSLIVSGNSTVIVFNTPPKNVLGEENVHSYNVSVQISGTSSNSIVFTYEAPVEITSIIPNSGVEEGGTEVVLSGTFLNFDFATSAVYIGGKKVSQSDIVYNDTQILFVTPARSDVGSSFTYDVWVTIGSLRSNTVLFTYEATSSGASINASGGSLDSDGHYQLGACVDSLYRASISHGARTQDPVYKWTLTVDGDETDILAVNGIVTNADVLLIPHQTFPDQGVLYTLKLTVETEFASFEKTLILKQLGSQQIGVRISDPRPRSISDPNVTLTIPAELFIPGCESNAIITNSSEMAYEWTFRDVTYVFSHENKTAPEERVSPTLLGREFHIPQALMAYGSFPLSLTAYFVEQTSIRGSDATAVVIEPAPLFAQINGGETSQMISETEGFTISASQSRDPDVLGGDPSIDLQYEWSCRYGWSESMQNAVACDESLLSSSNSVSREFTVPPESFSVVQNSSSLVYVEYSLKVKKTSLNATEDEILRESDTVRNTLILPKEVEQRFESLKEITVINNQTVPVDKTKVKYYEDVIITPVSETEETTWSFELLSPASQSRTLLASDSNLLLLPGYFRVGAESGRLSLGLKANVLSPSTEYRFLISTFRTGYSVNEQVISLVTVDKPTILLGNFATPSGSTEDTYVLSAYASYDGDFKFFFILTDDFGFETCVGGCQGENVVQFRLATAGTYRVRCDVYDSLGYTLLGDAKGGNITVSDVFTGNDLSIFVNEVNSAFLAGDHATYQQLGSDMVKFIWSVGESQSPDLDSEILANFTGGMNQVAANAVPNPIQSAGYVRTAASLASLTPSLGITYDTQTLYYLVNITVSSIERVPDNGALQVLEDLLTFYDLTPELVLDTYSAGTTRRRLLREFPGQEDEVLDIWLDLYEVMKDQIVITVLKRCSCGCVEEVSTGLASSSLRSLSSRRLVFGEARNLSAVASYLNPTQGRLSPVSMQLAHFCNSEQGTQLLVNKGTEEQVQFSWCKGVFENSVKKLYFALAKTPDYVYMSKLRNNVTLSDGLVATVIAQIKGNDITDATLAIDGCYRVQMPVLRNFTDSPDDIPDEEEARGLLLTPAKDWGRPVSLALYSPVFAGIETSIGDTSATSGTNHTTATLTLSTTGVLAIGTRIHWLGGFFSLEGFLLLAAEIAGVTLSILVLLLVSSVSAWMIATRLFAAPGPLPPVEADFTYVERDVYGRGTALDMGEQYAPAS